MDSEKVLALLNEIQSGVGMAKNLIPNGQVQDALALESLIAGLISNSLKAYNLHKGEPYDLNNLPQEDEV